MPVMVLPNGLRKHLSRTAAPDIVSPHDMSPLEDTDSDNALDHVQNGKAHFLDKKIVSSPSGEGSDSGSRSGSETESEEEASEKDEAEGASSPTPTPTSHPLPPEELVTGQSVRKGWYEFDLSVIVALVSPIGNWLTGGDHVKNLLLLLMLIFYLHQIIEVPWSLYHASRPRRRAPGPPPKDASAEDRYRYFASSELHKLETFYLILTVLSPFGGVFLLRSVVLNLAGDHSISWFSTTLFVLATGMRPWKHAIERLRQRTSDLHDIVHNTRVPEDDMQKTLDALAARVAVLETQLELSRKAQMGLSDDMYSHLDDTLSVVERSARKQDRRVDMLRAAHETRFAKLEAGVEELLERKEISANGHFMPGSLLVSTGSSMAESPLVAALREQLSPILPAWAVGGGKKDCSPRTSPRSPRSPKTMRARTLPTLETIPEREVFRGKADGKAKGGSRWIIPIPGLGLVLRMGDLATLPIRAVVNFLLSGRIWSPK